MAICYVQCWPVSACGDRLQWVDCSTSRPAANGHFLPVAKARSRLWIQPVDATQLNFMYAKGVLQMKQIPRIYYTESQKKLMRDHWQIGDSPSTASNYLNETTHQFNASWPRQGVSDHCRQTTQCEEKSNGQAGGGISGGIFRHEKGQCCEHWPKSLNYMAGTE